MKKTLSFLVACFVCIGAADAALRATNNTARTTNTISSRGTASRNGTSDVVSRTTDASSRATAARTATDTKRTTVSRTATAGTTRTGNVTQRTTNARSAQTTSRTNTNRASIQQSQTSRATTSSKTFGVGYNSCRDAYFTCMDQFCATADDTYRRCICSSRLSEIKKKQHALGDAADQIQNFKDLNIEVIPKTSAEVTAMLNASKGEYAASIAKDTSDSAQKLAGISAVLTKTKSKSLSTAGTLDIAGDINTIWATTDLASGVNIANLTGEPLYNAVHSQCANLVADHCESKSTLNMVIAAYGMYIENDCTLLSNALGKQKTNANATIRETEREMQVARLDNYNAHNSTSINDCVARVRADITKENACGTDYVHCLDVSGLYLNKTTGEPIYTANFYQLETMLSLSGDILTNQTNRLFVAELNRKRDFAEKSLSTCQDLADDVWDEFLRQAVTEIYQGQQSRIRQVKDECLEVVNKCYDQQTSSLRDFSNTKEQLLLGSQLELSEQLCREKLSACSNLYGGGTEGMQELISTMYNITSQKIAQNCLVTLKEYAESMCAVPSSDTLHSYPYACRVYEPGEQKYAILWKCQSQSQNKRQSQSWSSDDDTGTDPGGDGGSGGGDSGETPNYIVPYMCANNSYYYETCNANFYLSDCGNTVYYESHTVQPNMGNSCLSCPNGASCAGGNACPVYPTQPDPTPEEDVIPDECQSYVGSLYQKIVSYALQACMRPSEIEVVTKITDATGNDITPTPISTEVLQDVNATMDMIRVSMSESLGAECERLGGYWIATPYNNETEKLNGSSIKIHTRFYNETGANTKWGYCANADEARKYYNLETTSTSSGSSGGQSYAPQDTSSTSEEGS